MLKRINNTYTLYKKLYETEKARIIQNEYNKDKIFISTMLNGTYGTVREQIEAFENGMKYFMDEGNAKECLSSINEILEQENSNRIQKLQDTLSIGGLLFTMFLGLPSITDTVILIRELFSFIKINVPYISVEGFSFAIWILILLFMLKIVYRQTKKALK